MNTGYLFGGMLIFAGLMIAIVADIPPSTPIQQTGDLTVEVRVWDVSQIGEYYVVRGSVIFSFKGTPLPVMLNFSNARMVEQDSGKAFDDSKTIIISFTAVTNSTVLEGTADIGGIMQVPVSFDALKLYEQQKSGLEREKLSFLAGGIVIGGLVIVATYIWDRKHPKVPKWG